MVSSRFGPVFKRFWQLVLPLAILSFFFVTKWRYVLVVDGPDEFLYGFPFVWYCDGWHTSLSFQVFVGPLLLDFLIYALCWFGIIQGLGLLKPDFQIPKWIWIPLVGIATVLLGLLIFIGLSSNSIFGWEVDFDYEWLESGWSFFWEPEPRLNFLDYR